MVDNIKNKEDFSSLVITTLAILVIILLGIIGYAYYTKDKFPKNKIVKFFSTQRIVFSDLPLSEQDKYVLKSKPLEVLEPNEMGQSEVIQELKKEVSKDKEPNKFLEKMARNQKETDEMVIEGKTKSRVIEEENKAPNKFLEKMAKNQKETDEMVIEGNKVSNKFLEKMAKNQKEIDEMILEENSKKKEKTRAEQLLQKAAKNQKEIDEMIIRGNSNSY